MNHKIIDRVHNNCSLVSNKLTNQNEIESTNPDITIDQLISLENIGPRNAEAKNICATSEEISESLENRESYNVNNVNFIQYNNIINNNNLSTAHPTG